MSRMFWILSFFSFAFDISLINVIGSTVHMSSFDITATGKWIIELNVMQSLNVDKMLFFLNTISWIKQRNAILLDSKRNHMWTIQYCNVNYVNETRMTFRTIIHFDSFIWMIFEGFQMCSFFFVIAFRNQFTFWLQYEYQANNSLKLPLEYGFLFEFRWYRGYKFNLTIGVVRSFYSIWTCQLKEHWTKIIN